MKADKADKTDKAKHAERIPQKKKYRTKGKISDKRKSAAVIKTGRCAERGFAASLNRQEREGFHCRAFPIVSIRDGE